MFLDMVSSSPAEILLLELRRYFFVMDKNGHKVAWAVNVNNNCVTRLALLDPFCKAIGDPKITLRIKPVCGISVVDRFENRKHAHGSKHTSFQLFQCREKIKKCYSSGGRPYVGLERYARPRAQFCPKRTDLGW